MSALPINQAARVIGKSPATLRRWIAEGAPCVSPGEPGRGHGAIVNINDLLRWRHGIKQRDETEFLSLLAVSMLDFYKRDTGINEPAHKTIGIPDREAAAMLVLLFEYVAQRLGQQTLPEEIAHIRAVCVTSENSHRTR